MKKKYFTKCLPVEGEIKKGDQFTDGETIMTCDKPDLIHPSDKKVKLFLCSRDIQVGDKCRYNMAPESEHFADDECLKMDCFKVIGEISPEAVWIKEGMEFDDKDLAYIMGEKGHPFYHRFSNIRSPEVEKMKTYPIAIMCPTCKTFH